MKKRRMLSWLLAVVMCLSILPFTVSAADELSATARGVTITIDKSHYQQGERFRFSWSGVSKDYNFGVTLGSAYIAVAGSAHDEYVDYEPVNGVSLTWSEYIPNKDGAYELRLYYDAGDVNPNDETFIVSLPFTVGNVKTGTISLPQTEYTANTQIVVDYSGITTEMVNAGSLIGIYKVGAEHGGSSYWDGSGNVAAGSGKVEMTVPNINGDFEVRLYNTRAALEDHFVMSVPFTISGATASEWAVDELEKAEELGLIPEILDGADLTADITRAEFAAVAVKVYENLANGEAIPAVINPFTDTKDVEILKAYNIGAVNGTSATTYSPDDLLNREQAAAMLTRVFKKISIPNWTLATDGQFTLPYEKPALFADDKDISDWAKESVYFMVANGIINGVGDNKFAPQNTTTEEQAQGYANATREQALLIAVRMVENLK